MEQIDGKRLYDIAERIYPICRSLTGNGVRQTLDILKEYIPTMRVVEVPSGTQVYDWTVPKEWNIKAGRIEDESGEIIVDFLENNLHIMGYSIPVDKWVDLEELKEYIYTEPSQPNVIPYVTSYYKERYGFCMSENQKNSLRPGRYHMVIESELKIGSLSFGEMILKGASDKEILLSTYICHPSMANNECSGPALAVGLACWLQTIPRNYTYRIIFIPETIGSIMYLSKNLCYLKEHVVAGFNLSCVGDNLDYSIVESRYGNTLADKALKHTMKVLLNRFSTYSFLKRGSDERQYNAPGVDLPVVAFCRSKYGEYAEYHTSADNMDFISAEGFQGSFDVMTYCITVLENNLNYKMTVLCEPQLGKRGLYPTISHKGNYGEVVDMMNFIAYADGKNDLIDIAEIIDAPAGRLIPIARKLLEAGLVKEVIDGIY